MSRRSKRAETCVRAEAGAGARSGARSSRRHSPEVVVLISDSDSDSDSDCTSEAVPAGGTTSTSNAQEHVAERDGGACTGTRAAGTTDPPRRDAVVEDEEPEEAAVATHDVLDQAFIDDSDSDGECTGGDGGGHREVRGSQAAGPSASASASSSTAASIAAAASAAARWNYKPQRAISTSSSSSSSSGRGSGDAIVSDGDDDDDHDETTMKRRGRSRNRNRGDGSAVAGDGGGSWDVKYRPSSSADVPIHASKKASVKQWIQGCFDGDPVADAAEALRGGGRGVLAGSTRVLILHGPSGVGKSSLLELLCSEAVPHVHVVHYTDHSLRTPLTYNGSGGGESSYSGGSYAAAVAAEQAADFIVTASYPSLSLQSTGGSVAASASASTLASSSSGGMSAAAAGVGAVAEAGVSVNTASRQLLLVHDPPPVGSGRGSGQGTTLAEQWWAGIIGRNAAAAKAASAYRSRQGSRAHSVGVPASMPQPLPVVLIVSSMSLSGGGSSSSSGHGGGRGGGGGGPSLSNYALRQCIPDSILRQYHSSSSSSSSSSGARTGNGNSSSDFNSAAWVGSGSNYGGSGSGSGIGLLDVCVISVPPLTELNVRKKLGSVWSAEHRLWQAQEQVQMSDGRKRRKPVCEDGGTGGGGGQSLVDYIAATCNGDMRQALLQLQVGAMQHSPSAADKSCRSMERSSSSHAHSHSHARDSTEYADGLVGVGKLLHLKMDIFSNFTTAVEEAAAAGGIARTDSNDSMETGSRSKSRGTKAARMQQQQQQLLLMPMNPSPDAVISQNHAEFGTVVQFLQHNSIKFIENFYNTLSTSAEMLMETRPSSSLLQNPARSRLSGPDNAVDRAAPCKDEVERLVLGLSAGGDSVTTRDKFTMDALEGAAKTLDYFSDVDIWTQCKYSVTGASVLLDRGSSGNSGGESSNAIFPDAYASYVAARAVALGKPSGASDMLRYAKTEQGIRQSFQPVYASKSGAAFRQQQAQHMAAVNRYRESRFYDLDAVARVRAQEVTKETAKDAVRAEEMTKVWIRLQERDAALSAQCLNGSVPLSKHVHPPRRASTLDGGRSSSDIPAPEVVSSALCSTNEALLEQIPYTRGLLCALKTAADSTVQQPADAEKRLYEREVALEERMKQLERHRESIELSTNAALRHMGVNNMDEFQKILMNMKLVQPENAARYSQQMLDIQQQTRKYRANVEELRMQNDALRTHAAAVLQNCPSVTHKISTCHVTATTLATLVQLYERSMAVLQEFAGGGRPSSYISKISNLSKLGESITNRNSNHTPRSAVPTQNTVEEDALGELLLGGDPIREGSHDNTSPIGTDDGGEGGNKGGGDAIVAQTFAPGSSVLEDDDVMEF